MNDKDNQPRYRRIANELLDEITAGRMVVGDRLPGEHELRERYSVSRHTVREALRVLEDLGLIDRFPGVGTVVVSAAARDVYVQSIGSVSELLQYPGDTRLMVTNIAEVTADEALAEALGVENGSRWTRISGRRVRSGAVLTLCHTDVFVIPAYADVADLIGRDGQPVYALIEHRFGEQVRDVQVEIGARAVDGALAAELDVADGSPALKITRRYIGASGLFEVSVTTHPADRFTYALSLQRGWQPANGPVAWEPGETAGTTGPGAKAPRGE